MIKLPKVSNGKWYKQNQNQNSRQTNHVAQGNLGAAGSVGWHVLEEKCWGLGSRSDLRLIPSGSFMVFVVALILRAELLDHGVAPYNPDVVLLSCLTYAGMDAESALSIN